jgi:prepilin peptidase CpaA
MSFSVPPRAVEAILLLVVLIAAAYDIRYRRIPNWLTGPAVLVALVLNAFLQAPAPHVISFGGFLFALKGLALAFGSYFFLYALRAMGPGDVKLMAAVGAFVGWQDWFGIFLITAIIGGIAAVVFSLMRGRLKTTVWNVGFILSEMGRMRPAYLGKEELDVRSKKGLGLPHGAVIAAGTLLFFLAGHLALQP